MQGTLYAQYIHKTDFFCTKSYTWLCNQVCILKVGVKKAHLILGVIVEVGRRRCLQRGHGDYNLKLAAWYEMALIRRPAGYEAATEAAR